MLVYRNAMLVVFLLLLAALSPLYYGAVYEWTWALAGLSIGLAALATGGQVVLGRSSTHPQFGKMVLPALCVLLVLVWTYVQWSTWTPIDWHHPIWSLAAETLDTPYVGRISMDPDATFLASLRLLIYAVLFGLALHAGRDGARATLILKGIVFVIAAYALVAIIIRYSVRDGTKA